MAKSSNLGQLQVEIPWRDLPSTFQDAIEFALCLGLEYLWIDSLCIIQDDLRDWEEEAAKMAAYFSNACITLAASAAKDSSVPLFPTCAPEPLHIEGHISGRPYHIMALPSFPHPRGDSFRQEMFPLLQRGWVYQEIFLSPRVLHFSGGEVVYICRSDAWCQCDLADSNDHLSRNQVKETPHPSISRDPLQPWQVWNIYVSDLSYLSFTYEKDRLAAMAGLAARFATVYDTGKYLAGLWEKHMIRNLCWKIGAPFEQEMASRPDELSTIPSWSWASTKGKIRPTIGLTFDLPPLPITSVVVEIDVKPANPSYLGHLDRGIITLRGLTFKAIIVLKKSELFNVPEYAILKDNKQRDGRRPDFFERSFFPDDLGWGSPAPLGRNVSILEMACEANSAEKWPTAADFLVLEEVEDGEGDYKRVGFLHVSPPWPRKEHDGTGAFLNWVRKGAVLSALRIR